MVTKSFWTTARRVPPRLGISPAAAMAGIAPRGGACRRRRPACLRQRRAAAGAAGLAACGWLGRRRLLGAAGLAASAGLRLGGLGRPVRPAAGRTRWQAARTGQQRRAVGGPCSSASRRVNLLRCIVLAPFSRGATHVAALRAPCGAAGASVFSSPMTHVTPGRSAVSHVRLAVRLVPVNSGAAESTPKGVVLLDHLVQSVYNVLARRTMGVGGGFWRPQHGSPPARPFPGD